MSRNLAVVCESGNTDGACAGIPDTNRCNVPGSLAKGQSCNVWVVGRMSPPATQAIGSKSGSLVVSMFAGNNPNIFSISTPVTYHLDLYAGGFKLKVYGSNANVNKIPPLTGIGGLTYGGNLKNRSNGPIAVSTVAVEPSITA